MRGSHDQHLNGGDYLMLGFDHELRRHGFAGNSCQIVLELGSPVSADALKSRLRKLRDHFPILSSRPGGVFLPRWKPPRDSDAPSQVRVHRDEPGLCHKLFNEPLASDQGELARFDLIECDAGRMKLLFTWAHAVMDAPGAEQLLALLGREDLPWPDWPPIRPPNGQHMKLIPRAKLAWKYIYHLDRLCEKPPKSLGMRHQDAPHHLHHRVESFSTEETARVREASARHCGILGAAQYHAAAAAIELHQMHQRLKVPSPSYVMPLPVGLRPKGSVETLFGNQVAMLMLQFLPEHLDSVAHAATVLKAQIAEGMRGGLLESGRMLGELFRFLPLSIYTAMVKQGLRGEIGSLFYGDTAEVNPRLTNFLGVPIQDFVHVAAVTPSPGIGVIFYYFRGQLRVTILHLLTVLDDAEAAEFARGLRARLLES